jgi:16S rRNA (cytidine1402-2'-O)-methyltransferase
MSHVGSLYVVATPIGNMQDMSPRAVQVLNEVDLILAERPTHSKKLLSHFNVPAKPVKPYQDQNESSMSEYVLGLLLQGQNIALISDAGTPLISDPGYQVVRKALEANVPVHSVAGPCALSAAWSVGAIGGGQFLFLGFVSHRSSARQSEFKKADEAGYAFAFYESPHRLMDCLADLQAVVGASRVVSLVKELTKQHERIYHGTLEDVQKRLEGIMIKGEWVILVSESPQVEQDYPMALAVELSMLIGKSAASKMISQHFGVQKNQVYTDLKQEIK